MNTLWQITGKVNPQELTESRLQLHYAIQLVAATGAALAEPLPDYSHTSLGWNPVLRVFVGSAIQAARSFQVALDPVSLTVMVLDQQSDAIASLPLHGKTLAEGLSWLKQEVSKRGADASKIVFLDYPPDDFPDHPLAHGAAFDACHELALSELADYYANTHLLLQDIIAITEDASADRIWPHHFDMATLITLSGTRNGSPLTVGVGLSPGDASNSEPYWYVSPYPYPDTARLPDLDGYGFWHTRHWVGAVLPASRTKALSGEAQQRQVEAFVHSALRTSLLLLNCEAAAEV